MNDEYSSKPTFLREALQEWMEANKTRTPFWRRVLLWADLGVAWDKTRWTYPTLHGISTTSYPKWSDRP